jgi:hypothetical protein
MKAEEVREALVRDSEGQLKALTVTLGEVLELRRAAQRTGHERSNMWQRLATRLDDRKRRL